MHIPIGIPMIFRVPYEFRRMSSESCYDRNLTTIKTAPFSLFSLRNCYEHVATWYISTPLSNVTISLLLRTDLRMFLYQNRSCHDQGCFSLLHPLPPQETLRFPPSNNGKTHLVLFLSTFSSKISSSSHTGTSFPSPSSQQYNL